MQLTELLLTYVGSEITFAVANRLYSGRVRRINLPSQPYMVVFRPEIFIDNVRCLDGEPKEYPVERIVLAFDTNSSIEYSENFMFLSRTLSVPPFGKHYSFHKCKA